MFWRESLGTAWTYFRGRNSKYVRKRMLMLELARLGKKEIYAFSE